VAAAYCGGGEPVIDHAVTVHVHLCHDLKAVGGGSREGGEERVNTWSSVFCEVIILKERSLRISSAGTCIIVTS
jgi:hypothetical protein